MKSRFLAALLAGAVLAAVSGCGGGNSTPRSETITVFAAASLTRPFNQLARDFEAAHPNVMVRLEFGGSPTLVEQVNQGAPVDVLATASKKTMAKAKFAVKPVVFATNVLEIAVPPTNPAHVRTLGDLVRPGVKVAICQVAVPCGAVAAEVLKKAHVRIVPATEEIDVTAVLTKVALGEVDAGLVYVTDVRGDGSVKGVEIPASENAATKYPIALLSGSKHKAAADAFIAYVTGIPGQALLASDGWGRP